MPICKGTNKSGLPCTFHANPSGYCHVHDPEVIAARKARQQIDRTGPPQRLADENENNEWVLWLWGIGIILFIILWVFLSAETGGGGYGGGYGQCRSGKPCGASCISWDKTCHQ